MERETGQQGDLKGGLTKTGRASFEDETIEDATLDFPVHPDLEELLVAAKANNAPAPSDHDSRSPVVAEWPGLATMSR
jgi:hypothetical protein